MKKHGFTLIELLVVIAVLALLVCAVVPACKKVLNGDRSRQEALPTAPPPAANVAMPPATRPAIPK